MAPYLQGVGSPYVNVSLDKTTGSALHYEPGRTFVDSHEDYEHKNLLPYFPDVKWSPLEEFLYHDKGLHGDKAFVHLLSGATSIFDYTPKIGTEISGIDLANLTDPQKNDLARLIATRGVVFFRDQSNFDINAQRELGSYFGALHMHATTSVPNQPGLENVHVVFTEGNKDMRAMFTPSFLWHSDVCITGFTSTTLCNLRY